jgi:hypothetical protein
VDEEQGLAPNTVSNYRSRLRLLKRALEAGYLEGEDVEIARREIATLERKLAPYPPPKRPGRKRVYVRIPVAVVEELRAGGQLKDTAAYWTQEAIGERAKRFLPPTEEETKEMNRKAEEDSKKFDELMALANEELAKKGREPLKEEEADGESPTGR